VETATGGLFIVGWLQAQSLVEVLWWWVLLSVLLLIVVYDLHHYIIPDGFTVMVTLLAILKLGYEYWWIGTSLTTIGYTALAATLGAAFFYGLWWYSGGRWLGFGDVKLVWPLGLLVGALGVFSMIVASFWVGAVVSLGVLGYQRWQVRGKPPLRQVAAGLTMKSAVPFAPFLVAGALLVLCFNFNALSLFQ
jgi:leader peptidase (prepilin peptidase)/N-methyltransferase